MQRKWIGLLAIGLIALGVVFSKTPWQRTPEGQASSMAQALKHPAVILVADPREANDPYCPCGKIIRMVRAAGKRGISIQEVPPDRIPESLKPYQITVAPTVLFLDGKRQEVIRYVGEDPKTVQAIEQRLIQLKPAKP